MSVVRSCRCGYSSPAGSSPAHALHAWRRHSCEKQHRLAVKAERARQREALVDRTPRPCLHKRARHEHGTKAAYSLDECRCVPCSKAAVVYARTRYRQMAYGRWEAYVDAGPAREHVQALRAAGMGWKQVARAAGVPNGAMSKLLYGYTKRGMAPSRRIRRSTEAKILAVESPTSSRVDATGTRRRLQALVAVDWSQSKLARRLGMNASNMPALLARATVMADTAEAVRRLYDELWNVRPPEQGHRDKIAASRSRSFAAAKGWAPPMAWDDDTIDDPKARPVGVRRPLERQRAA